MFQSSSALPLSRSSGEIAAEAHPVETFDQVYNRHAPFMWRAARRLGIPERAIDDVIQDVFVVVHRRLLEFQPGTSMKAWLSAILIRIVRQHRRSLRRGLAGSPEVPPFDPEALADPRAPSPYDVAERKEALVRLYSILDRMEETRREVFVLAELEEMTAPEIAAALAVNVNTVYWRLRTARREFEKAIVQQSAAQRRKRP